MQYRVAFFGPARWLRSTRVQAVRRDRRIVVAALRVDEPFTLRDLPDDTEIALLHVGDDVDRSLTLARSAADGTRVRFVAVAREMCEDVLSRVIGSGLWGTIHETATPHTYGQSIARVGAGRLAYPPGVLDRIRTRGGRMSLLPYPCNDARLR